jgi:hypothetical protein
MDKPLSLPVKLLLLGAGIISLIAGPVLYLFPRHTSVYFAWTIQAPLTAVFMGAAYITAGVGLFLALRSNAWSQTRQVLPAVIIFALSQLIATLLHIGIFNWSHPIAYAWIAVYILAAPAAVPLLVQNERGYRPPVYPRSPLEGILSPLMALLAVLFTLTGLGLFLFPAALAPVWPWPITPLTGRVIGGWLLTVASLAWMAARQRGLQGARVVQQSLTVFSVLQLAGAVMFLGEMGGPLLSIALYLLVLFLLGLAATLGWWDAQRSPGLDPDARLDWKR